MIVILIGVAGAGKTTVGCALSERLQWPFVDADDLHSPENIQKMRHGVALDDADRRPWLARVNEVMRSASGRRGLVLACSALKEQYRAEMARGVPDARWVWLRAGRELLLSRLSTRQGHFAGPALLDSQLATLEPPAGAAIVDAGKPVQALVDEICSALRLSCTSE
jgi:gluconokinase